MQLLNRLNMITRDRIVLACMVSIFCFSFSGAILNAEVYARIAPYFGVGRELSTFMQAVLFLAVAFVAVKKPSLFDVKTISLVTIAVLVVSGFLLALSLELQNPLFVMVSLLCRAAGQVWAITVFSVALTTISSLRTVLVTVGIGMVLSGFVWQLVPPNLPVALGSFFVVLCAIVPIALTWKVSVPLFQTIRQSAAASSIGVSDSSVFVGVSKLKGLYFCMLLVSVASGYALAFNEQSNAPIVTVVENIVLAAIVVVVLMGDSAKEHEGREDQLFSFAALLIIAGYLVAPFSFGHDTTVTNTLLRAGRDCFTLLVWLVLAAIGRRNIFLLLPILGSVRFMSAIGTDIGAMAGHVTNGLLADSSTTAAAITTAFAFAFIAFLWLGFRDFSFTRVINDVKEVSEPEILRVGDHMEARSRLLGIEHGLTDREIDILQLLARGRDGKFIAEEFVLSYNTVKTHIKHIYQKLGVHSRQELIDLVGES
ncbi:helix-turn-helix transcriptional regulator [Raoultibacter phocaeensis]|uniref:helix-turn-helix transcriptional regulator n=1 Tax=Raoultibacter phocaeensis TaxID=2479841 RepID=UPI0011191124|nr:helix-turn-helix transcriptional regulator [Raoultibacter phocaeensis]